MPKSKKTQRFFWSATFIFMMLGIVVGTSNLLLRLDNSLLDSLVSKLADRNTPDPDIVVIDINNDSLEQLKDYAGRWPWPRSIHANLIELLEQQHPKAIIFDVFFSEPDINRPDADQFFAETIAKTNNVFLPIVELNSSKKDQGALIRELPATLGFIKSQGADPEGRAQLLLPAAIPDDLWKVGTINFTEDKEDGVGRRQDIYRTIAGWRLPSLPTRVISFLGINPPNEQTIVLDWQKNKKDAYPTYSYAQVLVNLSQQVSFPSKDYFKDKIIIIGSTATGLHDLRVTPISNLHPGLYILATAIDNIKNKEYFSPGMGWLGKTLLNLLLLALVCLTFIKTKQHVLKALVGVIVLSVALLSLTYWGVIAKHLLPVASTLLLMWSYFFTISLWQYFQEFQAKRRIQDLFSRFLDPNVVQHIVSEGLTDDIRQGQERNISVLFSDIRNFTTMSEAQTPHQTIVMLNNYFTEQVAAIFKHKGTLDKFIGDAIMAFWGAPIPLTLNEHATACVSAALTMIDNLATFKKTYHLPDFDIGIGIHTGNAVVGMVGAQQHLDYTAIGDTINLASRIEGLTKGIACILVSEETKNACGDSFDFIEHGYYKVKGREQEVRLYEPRRKPLC